MIKKNILLCILQLVLGQIISISIAGTAICGSALWNFYKLDLQMLQMCISYFLVFVTYSIFYFSKKDYSGFFKRWYIYIALAIVDVEANFCATKAYQYTSTTNALILATFTIPCVLLGTIFVFKLRYPIQSYVGILVCLAGQAVTIYFDAVNSQPIDQFALYPIIGDLLCLLAAVLYSVGNVSQEYIVKYFSRVEYLVLFGTSATIISGIQMSILEHNKLQGLNAWQPILLILLFSLFLYTLYSLAPVVMKSSGSLFFNMSCLTSHSYALLAEIFIFHRSIGWSYLLSLALVITGLIINSIYKPISPNEN